MTPLFFESDVEIGGTDQLFNMLVGDETAKTSWHGHSISPNNASSGRIGW